MSRTRTPVQSWLRIAVLLAVALQMTAIPTVGRVRAVSGEPVCPPSACRESSIGGPIPAACSPAPTDCASSCSRTEVPEPVGGDPSIEEPDATLPGCAGDPFRCEDCTGCPIWCSTPFLTVLATGRILPFGDVLLRLCTAVDRAESLALDPLTPPPKPA